MLFIKIKYRKKLKMYINKLTLSKTNTVLINPSIEQAYRTLNKYMMDMKIPFVMQEPFLKK